MRLFSFVVLIALAHGAAAQVLPDSLAPDSLLADTAAVVDSVRVDGMEVEQLSDVAGRALDSAAVAALSDT